MPKKSAPNTNTGKKDYRHKKNVDRRLAKTGNSAGKEVKTGSRGRTRGAR
jgi:ATP-dependent RNA helicase RhlE